MQWSASCPSPVTGIVYVDHVYTLQKDNLEIEATRHEGTVHLRVKLTPYQINRKVTLTKKMK